MTIRSKNDPGQEILYERLCPQEFLERLRDCPVAYLPLGTLEWHGPHLPLGTDMREARELFILAARQIGGIVLPGLFLGPDRHKTIGEKTYYGMDLYEGSVGVPEPYPPQQMPGSAYWVDDMLYDQILWAVLCQLARAGFRVVAGCGHGPSVQRFLTLAERAGRELGLSLAAPDVNAKDHRYVGDHAAASESSNVLYFEAELVHMERFAPTPGAFPPGVGGQDPRLFASAAHCEAILPYALARLRMQIEAALCCAQ